MHPYSNSPLVGRPIQVARRLEQVALPCYLCDHLGDNVSRHFAGGSRHLLAQLACGRDPIWRKLRTSSTARGKSSKMRPGSARLSLRRTSSICRHLPVLPVGAPAGDHGGSFAAILERRRTVSTSHVDRLGGSTLP